jgi:serine protease Do
MKKITHFYHTPVFILFIILINSTSTYAQRQADNSDISNQRQNVITKTVAQCSSAVVGINVTEIRQYRDFFNPFAVYNQPVKGLGSGSIISPDGYILTNDHVAGNAVEAVVTLTDGKQYTAKVIGSDQTSDICLLKIDGKDLPYFRMGDSNDIMPGEWVIAFGNPFGLFDINDKPSVTVGVISATGMNLGASENRYYINMIQTDAAINQGNSGGPLVNAVGELIAMNTLIYTAQGSSGNIGVGFAIPVNKIKRIIEELKAKHKVDRDFWTGLSVITINENIAKTYKLATSRGVFVSAIERNSPALRSGIKLEDIIVGVDDYRINDENILIGILNEYRTGDVVNFKVLRDGKELIMKMKLEKR